MTTRRPLTRTLARITAASGTALVLASLPAQAHHAMGGGKVTTFGQGLLSGLAHPIIGLDHCIFLLAIGALSALVPGGILLIAAFLVASFAGVVVHLAEFGMPFVEPALAVTILAAGTLLIAGGMRTRLLVLALATVGGVLHGYALAESIVGAEPTPLTAYLVGLTMVQGTLMAMANSVGHQFLDPATHSRQRLQWAGGAVCLAGGAFLIASLVGA